VTEVTRGTQPQCQDLERQRTLHGLFEDRKCPCADLFFAAKDLQAILLAESVGLTEQDFLEQLSGGQEQDVVADARCTDQGSPVPPIRLRPRVEVCLRS
jgi:hypothetical protein